MTKYLIVVDMQNDFVSGRLSTKESKNIVANVIEKIKQYPAENVHYTLDTHFEFYDDTLEGLFIPEHCKYKTYGWQLDYDVAEATRFKMDNEWIKSTFASREMPKWFRDKSWEEDDNIEIEIVGLCTDICVISNALILRSYVPNVKITVDASCCAGTTPEKHRAALDVMESCLIKVINKDDKIKGE